MQINKFNPNTILKRVARILRGKIKDLPWWLSGKIGQKGELQSVVIVQSLLACSCKNLLDFWSKALDIDKGLN